MKTKIIALFLLVLPFVTLADDWPKPEELKKWLPEKPKCHASGDSVTFGGDVFYMVDINHKPYYQFVTYSVFCVKFPSGQRQTKSYALNWNLPPMPKSHIGKAVVSDIRVSGRLSFSSDEQLNIDATEWSTL